MAKEFYLKHHSFHIKAIFTALKGIFENNEYADKAIEKVMKANKYWDVRERGFVSEVTYDMVRNWRLMLASSGVEPDAKLSDRTLWMIFGTYLVFDGYSLPESNYFKGLSEKKVISQLEKFHKIRKIRESLPDWLDEMGEKEIGKDWDKVVRALNQKPTTVLRANSLKTNPKELLQILEEESITEASLISWSPDAVELKFPRNVFRTEAFHKGLFEVQDASSQMVSEFLNVQPGMRVVDACAGAGGKTLHLASLMKNKGRIIALDVKGKKLEELKKRAARADVRIVETREIDSSKVVKRLKDTADRLLLDVPCSGLGVLRRNPDSKWKLNVEEIDRVKVLQKEILTNFSDITKVGGKMVYATCSILLSEGEDQIKWFLSTTGDKWNLVGEKRYSPDVYHADGFYMALLERMK
ncbi:MAG: RsmB/NOP family class I SAM-dependent RNA methyltransferase [Bacteroidetes bacterium]|nr:RsmB/NOP family class I SAM-dependent RNA methyltransferase [Bacteroidota bacterium]